MSLRSQIHVVDRDSARRAQIAFALSGGDLRAQIYDSPEELGRFPADSGLVLLSGDDDNSALAALNDILLPRRHYLPVVMYSNDPKPPKIVDAMLAGALDYLAWPFDAHDVETSLAKIQGHVTAATRAQYRRSSAEQLVRALSLREHEVLAGLVDGYANKVIGLRLGISPRTVEIHRANVLRKLGAGTSAEAVRIGLYAGIGSQ